ncbi:MAG: ribosome biogenesis GTP-binding protein YsxC [Alphaproteobacteria bacterium]|nr:MAG: ribosome biogenesis GTP-binding protein YsxC [Alphaproteobacteria bacterium]
MIKTYKVNQLPFSKYEIAFMGRSNVGKSSLLNRILQHKICRVSKTPGCTKWIGFYKMQHDISIVDLPGYGYANISKTKEGLISNMIYEYIESKRAKEIWILIDSRRDIMDLDNQILKFVLSYDIPVKIIATKCDKKDSKYIKADFYTSAKDLSGIQTIQEYLQNIKLAQ